MSGRASRIYLTLASLFVGLHVLGPIFGNKIGIVAGVSFSMATMMTPIGYVMLDTINDWKGKDDARHLVEATFIARLAIFLFLIPIIIAVPVKSEPAEFSDMLTQTAQLYFASFVSFLVGHWLFNVPVFSWVKEKMAGRWFVLRWFSVTVPAMLLSHTVNQTIGYWGTNKDIPALILGGFLVRVLLGLALIPVAFAVRRAVRMLV